MPADIKVPESAEIAYFTGCTAAYRQQALSVSTVRISDKLGTDFCTLGRDEWCCASALVRTGRRDLVKEYAIHNIDALEDRRAKTDSSSAQGICELRPSTCRPA